MAHFNCRSLHKNDPFRGHAAVFKNPESGPTQAQATEKRERVSRGQEKRDAKEAGEYALAQYLLAQKGEIGMYEAEARQYLLIEARLWARAGQERRLTDDELIDTFSAQIQKEYKESHNGKELNAHTAGTIFDEMEEEDRLNPVALDELPSALKEVCSKNDVALEIAQRLGEADFDPRSFLSPSLTTEEDLLKCQVAIDSALAPGGEHSYVGLASSLKVGLENLARGVLDTNQQKKLRESLAELASPKITSLYKNYEASRSLQENIFEQTGLDSAGKTVGRAFDRLTRGNPAFAALAVAGLGATLWSLWKNKDKPWAKAGLTVMGIGGAAGALLIGNRAYAAVDVKERALSEATAGVDIEAMFKDGNWVLMERLFSRFLPEKNSAQTIALASMMHVEGNILWSEIEKSKNSASYSFDPVDVATRSGDKFFKPEVARKLDPETAGNFIGGFVETMGEFALMDKEWISENFTGTPGSADRFNLGLSYLNSKHAGDTMWEVAELVRMHENAPAVITKIGGSPGGRHHRAPAAPGALTASTVESNETQASVIRRLEDLTRMSPISKPVHIRSELNDVVSIQGMPFKVEANYEYKSRSYIRLNNSFDTTEMWLVSRDKNEVIHYLPGGKSEKIPFEQLVNRSEEIVKASFGSHFNTLPPKATPPSPEHPLNVLMENAQKVARANGTPEPKDPVDLLYLNEHGVWVLGYEVGVPPVSYGLGTRKYAGLWGGGEAIPLKIEANASSARTLLSLSGFDEPIYSFDDAILKYEKYLIEEKLKEKSSPLSIPALRHLEFDVLSIDEGGVAATVPSGETWVTIGYGENNATKGTIKFRGSKIIYRKFNDHEELEAAKLKFAANEAIDYKEKLYKSEGYKHLMVAYEGHWNKGLKGMAKLTYERIKDAIDFRSHDEAPLLYDREGRHELAVITAINQYETWIKLEIADASDLPPDQYNKKVEDIIKEINDSAKKMDEFADEIDKNLHDNPMELEKNIVIYTDKIERVIYKNKPYLDFVADLENLMLGDGFDWQGADGMSEAYKQRMEVFRLCLEIAWPLPKLTNSEVKALPFSAEDYLDDLYDKVHWALKESQKDPAGSTGVGSFVIDRKIDSAKFEEVLRNTATSYEDYKASSTTTMAGKPPPPGGGGPGGGGPSGRPGSTPSKLEEHEARDLAASLLSEMFAEEIDIADLLPNTPYDSLYSVHKRMITGRLNERIAGRKMTEKEVDTMVEEYRTKVKAMARVVNAGISDPHWSSPSSWTGYAYDIASGPNQKVFDHMVRELFDDTNANTDRAAVEQWRDAAVEVAEIALANGISDRDFELVMQNFAENAHHYAPDTSGTPQLKRGSGPYPSPKDYSNIYSPAKTYAMPKQYAAAYIEAVLAAKGPARFPSYYDWSKKAEKDAGGTSVRPTPPSVTRDLDQIRFDSVEREKMKEEAKEWYESNIKGKALSNGDILKRHFELRLDKAVKDATSKTSMVVSVNALKTAAENELSAIYTRNFDADDFENAAGNAMSLQHDIIQPLYEAFLTSSTETIDGNSYDLSSISYEQALKDAYTRHYKESWF